MQNKPVKYYDILTASILLCIDEVKLFKKDLGLSKKL